MKKLSSALLIMTFVWLHIGSARAAKWKGEVDAGAVRTAGNIDTQSINAHGRLEVRYGKWTQILKGNALNTQNQGTTTGERYRFSLKTNYSLSDKSYLFGRIGYENDRFTGYRYRTSETAGYGRILIKNKSVNWDLELGGGARQSDLVDGSKKSDSIFRAATHAIWNISKSSKFKQEVEEEGGKDGWVTHSVTALQTQIIGNLSSKIYYRLTDTSIVPAGKKKLDTEIGVNLVYSFNTNPS